jgi:hypothetical protein
MAVAGLAAMEPRVHVPLHNTNSKQQVSQLPLDNSTSMLRIVTVIQQFMTEVNGAVSEEEKIVAITKIILNLMKQNDY